MPRRARRSYPTKDATDLTDAQWAAIAPLVITPSPNGGRPTEIDRRAIVNRPAGQTSHGLSMAHASKRCSANELCSLLFRHMES
jgi:transposase